MEEEAVAAPPNFVVGLQVTFFSKVNFSQGGQKSEETFHFIYWVVVNL